MDGRRTAVSSPPASAAHEFRYVTLVGPDGDFGLAGIMDAARFLPEGAGSHWSAYVEVDDVHASVATVTALGGSVLTPPAGTPYGTLATVTDPQGATFKLRTG